MRALVTGAAGFVGSALVERLLAEGHQVEAVDDLSTGALANLAEARAGGGPLRFTKLDAASPDLAALVAHRPPDVLYHLAWPAAPVAGPGDDLVAVAATTVAVLEAARSGGAGKVVVACSAAVYGEPEALPVKESHPHRPLDVRGVAEAAVISLLALYREQHSLEGTALVLADVYGPRQAGGPAAWAASLRSGAPVTLAVESATDLLYVDDAVDALARAADRAGGLVVNVGTGRATPAIEVYRAVAAAVGADAPPVVPATGAVRPAVALDARRARLHLGWAPFTALADGVAATVASLPV